MHFPLSGPLKTSEVHNLHPTITCAVSPESIHPPCHSSSSVSILIPVRNEVDLQTGHYQGYLFKTPSCTLSYVAALAENNRIHHHTMMTFATAIWKNFCHSRTHSAKSTFSSKLQNIRLESYTSTTDTQQQRRRRPANITIHEQLKHQTAPTTNCVKVELPETRPISSQSNTHPNTTPDKHTPEAQ